MEKAFVDAKEDFEDKEDFLRSLDKNVRVAENNCLVFSASKLKMVLERAIQERSLTSDVKQPRTNQRCLLESGLQNQFGGEHRSPKYTSFVSLHENLVQRCLDLVEVKASDSLSIVCRTAPINIPASLSSSKMEFLLGSLKPHRRRSQSTSDLSKFVIESALAAGPDNIIIGPVRQQAIDRIEGNTKVSNLWKSPLVRHLGAVDCNMSLGNENLSGTKITKCSEAISSPSTQSISSPQKRVEETVAMRRQKYRSDVTDEMLISCSSSYSTSSYQSTSTGSAASVGLLHCKWKSGLPYFVFSMDERCEVYVANPCKVESSNDKGLDYMYFFHSRTDGKSERGGSANNGSDLVGKMKVSNSLILSPSNSKLTETEFVLFDVSEDHAEESSVHGQKGKKLPKKAVDVFRTNHLSKQKYGDASPKSKGLFWAPKTGMSGKPTEIGKENPVYNHLPPNLELAAIVVKEYCLDNSKKEAIGGWGLKFLEKATVEHAVTSLQSSENCKDVRLGNRSESVVSLNVLLPAGLHGGPRTRSGGPSSLTKRWRSGGHCDCGGWDVGCPLTVLNNRTSNAESSPEIEELESCKSFDLFIEGAKTQGVPTLKMVNIHEGLYFIHFQSSLSALQSFSIGVAIIHSRTPSLRPHVYRS